MNWLALRKVMVGLTLLGGIPVVALAQSAEQLMLKYGAFAGSEANAASLVNGLRTGAEVVLVGGALPPAGPNGTQPLLAPVGAPAIPLLLPPSIEVKFTPPTGDMGYGNVDSALALAKAVLAAIRIVESPSLSNSERQVTPHDIRAALVGGNVTTTPSSAIELPGILKMRAGGLGWGQIAKQAGVALKP